MEDFKQRLIQLHHCRGVGWKTIYQLLKHDPLLTSLFQQKTIPILKASTQEKLFEELESQTITEQMKQYEANNIHTITFFDDEYPAILKETYEPPWVLYGKGNKELLTQELKLAVVGSRHPTQYGRKAIEELFPAFIRSGIVIVSGLAAGIDTIAHETAVKYGGSTIAVIAGGIYHIYPKTNKELALNLMRKQLVISEYPPNTPPSRWQFPARNRIISGISRGTFVVEARKKSGSLITANFAVQEGRDVFALPGSVFSSCSTGVNNLIQQGAKLVQTADDVLEELTYY